MQRWQAGDKKPVDPEFLPEHLAKLGLLAPPPVSAHQCGHVVNAERGYRDVEALRRLSLQPFRYGRSCVARLRSKTPGHPEATAKP